jgi:transketolase
MRQAFSETLVSLAQSDPKVLLLTGDHGYALFDEFRKHCPDQFINCGVAEQNMVGMSAGLAQVGFRPFVYGLSAFVPVRVLEQIKLDVAHDDLHVVFVGDGAGFVYSHLGSSHQSTEDMACTRAIPNMHVLSPADGYEMTACMTCAYDLKKPVYLRMGKSDRGAVHENSLSDLQPGELIQLCEGPPDLPALLATGSMVRTALDINERHFPCAVWSVPSVKPLNVERICEISQTNCGIVVLEEHSTIGGLGSAIAEITSEHCPTRILQIGVNDRFSDRCGSYDYLLKEHGLDVGSINQKIDTFLENP